METKGEKLESHKELEKGAGQPVETEAAVSFSIVILNSLMSFSWSYLFLCLKLTFL